MRISLKSNISQIKSQYAKMLSQSNIEKLQSDIIDDLKKEGLQEINASVGADDYEDSEPVSVIERDNAIGIQGSQAIYDEYGTGTMGENTPHPEKDMASIPLNDYNSGKTIRENKSGESEASRQGIPVNGLYWTYKREGKKIYTQGRPAGMHVYKAKTKIKSHMKNIIKKRVGELLSNR